MTSPIGDLPVTGSVGRVERALSSIEANLAANRPRELALELGSTRERVDRFSVRAWWQLQGCPAGSWRRWKRHSADIINFDAMRPSPLIIVTALREFIINDRGFF
jgi:hypothetical protein